MHGDTTINGRHYKILAGTSSQTYIQGSTQPYYPGVRPAQASFYREDTLLNKVWGILKVDSNSAERLIFDGNWRVGDTVHCEDGYNNGRSEVIGIDSTFLLGNWYRVFYMQVTPNSTNNYNIIEGIGSTNGPAFPMIGYTFEYRYSLKCFSHDGIMPPVSPALDLFDNTTSCSPLAVVVNKGQDGITVVPNPGYKEMVMNIPADIRNASLYVTDGIGRRIADVSIDNELRINLGQYLQVEGVYYYNLRDQHTGRRYMGRFIYR
jgi:hypothetical protein